MRILVDVGSTTTDIIPISRGEVVALGRTDPDRLASGELVYTGALRTPVEAVVRRVPLGTAAASVSAEGFALTGDVHLWLGRLPAEDYTVNTPDGRPASREFAGERLARVVCADRDMLAEEDIDRLAGAVAEAQLEDVARAISRVRDRHPRDHDRGRHRPWRLHRRRRQPGGLGSLSFRLADAARPRGGPRRASGRGGAPAPARRAAGGGMSPVQSGDGGGEGGRRVAGGPGRPRAGRSRDRGRGGARRPLVVVPGGGPFADAVRRFDASARALPRVGALDGHSGARPVRPRPGRTHSAAPAGVRSGNASPRPTSPRGSPCSRRRAGCLPPTCCRTAGTRPATVWRRSWPGPSMPSLLVLVKPVGGAWTELADPCFGATCPAGLPVVVLGVEEVERLEAGRADRG